MLSFANEAFISDICLSFFTHRVKGELAYYDIFSEEDRLNTYSDMSHDVMSHDIPYYFS